MDKMYKCPQCGYQQPNEAPNQCPICGAGSDQFVLIAEETKQSGKVKARKTVKRNTEEEEEIYNPDLSNEDIASKYSTIVTTIIGVIGLAVVGYGIYLCYNEGGWLGWMFVGGGILVDLIAIITNAFIQTFVNISYRLAKIEDNMHNKK